MDNSVRRDVVVDFEPNEWAAEVGGAQADVKELEAETRNTNNNNPETTLFNAESKCLLCASDAVRCGEHEHVGNQSTAAQRLQVVELRALDDCVPRELVGRGQLAVDDASANIALQNGCLGGQRQCGDEYVKREHYCSVASIAAEERLIATLHRTGT